MFEIVYNKLDSQQCLIGVVITLICYHYYYSKRRFPKNYPPGPKGIPLLGVLPFITSRPDKKVFVSHIFSRIFFVQEGELL